MLYSRNTNTSGNIIKDNERTKHFHFILKRGPLFVISWEIDGGTYTQREDVLLYLLPGVRGCQRLHPLASRNTTDRLRVPRSTAILCTLSKSDCVVLITWSPSGYSPVVPDCLDRAALFTNHNVTGGQSTRGHKERTENPWHMLYNTNSAL